MFPFDFGFIPLTMGDDGDPLDIMALMDRLSIPSFQRSERDRPAGLFDRRYAVLPFLPRNATQHIEGSRRKLYGPSLPLLSLPALESHPAVAAEGDAGHDPERWRIAMPADAGSG